MGSARDGTASYRRNNDLDIVNEVKTIVGIYSTAKYLRLGSLNFGELSIKITIPS